VYACADALCDAWLQSHKDFPASRTAIRMFGIDFRDTDLEAVLGDISTHEKEPEEIIRAALSAGSDEPVVPILLALHSMNMWPSFVRFATGQRLGSNILVQFKPYRLPFARTCNNQVDIPEEYFAMTAEIAAQHLADAINSVGGYFTNA